MIDPIDASGLTPEEFDELIRDLPVHEREVEHLFRESGARDEIGQSISDGSATQRMAVDREGLKRLLVVAFRHGVKYASLPAVDPALLVQ